MTQKKMRIKNIFKKIDPNKSMKCSKCGERHVLKDNYCKHCGLELYKHKVIERKNTKDINAEDIFYYYGTVFENNRMTDWVKNSLVDFIKSKSPYETLYGGLTGEGELRFAITKAGYFFKSTEDSIIKEQLDYLKIKTKKIDNFKNKEQWLLYHVREMVGEKMEGNDLMRDSILECSSLLNEKITNKAVKIISDSIINKMLIDFYGQNILTSEGERMANDATFCFYLGYWANFFENVYNFFKK